MKRIRLPLILLTIVISFWSCQSDPEENISGAGQGQAGQDDGDNAGTGTGEEMEDQVFLGFYKSAVDADQALDVVMAMEQRTLEEERVFLALLITQGEMEKAAAEGDRMLELFPEDMDLLYMRAYIAFLTEDIEGRDQWVTRGLELNPDHGDMNMLRASILIAQRDYVQANRHLEVTLLEDPENFQALILKSDVLMHLGQGNDELNAHFLQEAVKTLDKVEEILPDYAYLYIDRARALTVLGEYGRAYQDLSKAIDLEPHVEWHYVDRARLTLKYRNDRLDALNDLRKCEEINPDNFLANVYLAGILFDELQFEESLYYFERVMEMRPDYYFAYEIAGTLFYTQGMYQEAKEAFLRAYESYSPETGYILLAALSMRQLGEIQQSNELLTQIARGLDRQSLDFEMVRFFIEGGSSYFVVDKLNKEENEAIRRRFNYYLGEYYLMIGSSGAASCFEDASQLSVEFEGRAAQWRTN